VTCQVARDKYRQIQKSSESAAPSVLLPAGCSSLVVGVRDTASLMPRAGSQSRQPRLKASLPSAVSIILGCEA